MRISGSATPSLSTRSRMISTERSRSASVSFWPLRRHRLQRHLEAALEVEAERRLLVERRAGNGEQADADERGREQADEDEVRLRFTRPG